MNFTVIPTLEKIALLHLTARICNDSEIKRMMRRYATWLNKDGMHIINKKISFFRLPKQLHHKVEILIRPIMLEICAWTFYIRYIHREVATFSHTSCSCLCAIDLEENLRWQTVGLIDKHLTYQGLIRDERLDTTFRFILACDCCSEADILELWQMLSHEMQQRFFKFKFIFLPVVNYWTNRLETAASVNYNFIPNIRPFPFVSCFDYSRNYLKAMYSFYKAMKSDMRGYFFGTYARNLDDLKLQIIRERLSEEDQRRATAGLVNVNNVTALKYFLEKFHPIKGEKLLEVVPVNHFISNELLVFCLSRMNDAQLTILLRNSRLRLRMLSCLLNPPWQECFLDFINRIWDTVTEEDLDQLISYVIKFKIEKGWQDFDYVKIIQELYEKSSNENRIYLRHHCPKIKNFLELGV